MIKLKTESCIANTVRKRIKRNNQMYIPSYIFRDIPIHLSINNCDFKMTLLTERASLMAHHEL